jgi:hypothetical protein
MDRSQQGPFIKTLGQRQLQQNAVNPWISIQLLDRGQELGRGGGRRQMVAKAADAHPGTGFFFIGHIDATGLILPHPQHRQSRWPAGPTQTGVDHGSKALLD